MENTIDCLAMFTELKAAHSAALAGDAARIAAFNRATEQRDGGDFAGAAIAFRALAAANPGRFGAACNRAARDCDRHAAK